MTGPTGNYSKKKKSSVPHLLPALGDAGAKEPTSLLFELCVRVCELYEYLR